MTSWQFFVSGWDWQPSVITGCAILLLAYFAAVRLRFPVRALSFVAGICALLLALVSPIDTLADTYLFSAHMVQHILLILIVPPLLILGIPAQVMEKMFRWSVLSRIEHILSYPTLAWSLGVGTMWIWHWPPLYNAALASQPVHIAEHFTFLIAAAIFWWPVISPVGNRRLAPLWAAVYVFGACTAHTVLAILITFAPVGIYPAYLQPMDTFGILTLLRNQWGLTPAVDQQWGGLLMWIPACAVYLTFILASLARWYRTPEEEEAISPLPVGTSSLVAAKTRRGVSEI